MCALYAASLLILVRSGFRLVQYPQGEQGALSKREVLGYVFDASLMLVVVVDESVVIVGRGPGL